ncbi:hypothetical protein Tcan_17779 [Toxocara canis]|uniref:Uncharacterized protein n=1 Tax=Toxocara canis TaxID=6265 RepID=A0A0B2UUP2_TOXCA|nr:hypothetical protein Tcan_17779 [Toxocara canis]
MSSTPPLVSAIREALESDSPDPFESSMDSIGPTPTLSTQATTTVEGTEDGGWIERIELIDEGFFNDFPPVYISKAVAPWEDQWIIRKLGNFRIQFVDCPSYLPWSPVVEPLLWYDMNHMIERYRVVAEMCSFIKDILNMPLTEPQFPTSDFIFTQEGKYLVQWPHLTGLVPLLPYLKAHPKADFILLYTRRDHSLRIYSRWDFEIKLQSLDTVHTCVSKFFRSMPRAVIKFKKPFFFEIAVYFARQITHGIYPVIARRDFNKRPRWAVEQYTSLCDNTDVMDYLNYCLPTAAMKFKQPERADVLRDDVPTNIPPGEIVSWYTKHRECEHWRGKCQLKH